MKHLPFSQVNAGCVKAELISNAICFISRRPRKLSFIRRRRNTGILNDDLHLYVKLLMLLYADDSVIISNNAENFQKCLNEFHDYCQMWKLNVNYNKIEIVIFHSRNNRVFEFKMGNHSIQITDRYKYLGTVFSKSGSFLNARKHVAEQAKKVMHLLLTRAANLDIPIDSTVKTFR